MMLEKEKDLKVQFAKSRRRVDIMAFSLIAFIVTASWFRRMNTDAAFYFMVASTLFNIGTYVMIPIALLAPDFYNRHRDLLMAVARVCECISSDLCYYALPDTPVMRSFQAVASNCLFWALALPGTRWHLESILVAQLIWQHRTVCWPAALGPRLAVIALQVACGVVLPTYVNKKVVERFRAAQGASGEAAREGGNGEAGQSKTAAGADQAALPKPPRLYKSIAIDEGYVGYKIKGIHPGDLSPRDVEALSQVIKAQVRVRGPASSYSVRMGVLPGCVLLVARIWADEKRHVEVTLDSDTVLAALPSHLRGRVTGITPLQTRESTTGPVLFLSDNVVVQLGNTPARLAVRVKNTEGLAAFESSWRPVLWMGSTGERSELAQDQVRWEAGAIGGGHILHVGLPPIHHPQVLHLALEGDAASDEASDAGAAAAAAAAATPLMSNLVSVTCLPGGVIADVQRGEDGPDLLRDIRALLEWLNTCPQARYLGHLSDRALATAQGLAAFAEETDRIELARWATRWLVPMVVASTEPGLALRHHSTLLQRALGCAEHARGRRGIEMAAAIVFPAITVAKLAQTGLAHPLYIALAVAPFALQLALMVLNPGFYSGNHGLITTAFRVAAMAAISGIVMPEVLKAGGGGHGDSVLPPLLPPLPRDLLTILPGYALFAWTYAPRSYPYGFAALCADLVIYSTAIAQGCGASPAGPAACARVHVSAFASVAVAVYALAVTEQRAMGKALVN